eukprot:m.331827 g.331827  ORF g.331827 m.331827 type:complete len:511 (-) comp20486_c0_seq1:185-1717(-)
MRCSIRISVFFIFIAVRKESGYLIAGHGEEIGTFVLFTDIHYDPYFGTPHGYVCNESSSPPQLPKFGCDSPLGLLTHTFSEAARIHPDPDFVLIAGDSVRHDGHLMPDSMHDIGEIIDTVLNTSMRFFPRAQTTHASTTDPHLRVLLTLGNNDVFEDYVLQVTDATENNTYLNFIAQHWSSQLTRTELLDVLSGGYYEREVTDGLRILSLNTIVYSVHHCDYGPPQQCLSGYNEDPFGQFAWLEQRLSAALEGNYKIYLLGHIAPIVTSYNHRELWKSAYVQAFLALVSRYDSVVAAMIFGHVHSDEFRVVDPTLFNLSVPILMSGAITPIYNNNPSFKVFRYDRDTKELLDSQVFAAPVQNPYTRWMPLVNSSTDLGFKNLSAKSISAAIPRLIEDDAAWDTYYNTAYRAGVKQNQSCGMDCRVVWYCLFTTASASSFRQCKSSVDYRRVLEGAMLGFGLVCCAVATVFLWRRYRSKQPARYAKLESVERGIEMNELLTTSVQLSELPT